MSQQIINIGSAPNDGTGDQLRVSFDKCNDNFTELYTSGAATTTEGIWNFNQTDTDTNSAPTSGRFRTNTGNFNTATQLAIHRISINGIDRANTLRTQIAGDIIKCQDQTNADSWSRYILQSDATDNGTWFQLNVAFDGGGGTAPGNNQEIIFSFTASSAGAGGGNVSNVGMPTNGQLAQWTDATHIQGIAVSSLGLAPLANPIFTGDPQAPTPATADNDTSIATTAFVKAQGYLVSTDLTPYAPLASPAFIGTPTAPTAAVGTSTTQIATTAFVDAESVAKVGDTMTGALTLPGTGTFTANQAAREVDIGAPQCGRLYIGSSTQINFFPCNGDRIKIAGVIYPIGSVISAANTGIYINGVAGQNLAANTFYYVYLFDNSGTLTIDFSTTGHGGSTVANNVGTEVKTGDNTRSLIGAVYTNASAQFTDIAAARFLLSWFNRRNRHLAGASTNGATTTSTTLIEITSSARAYFINWAEEAVQASFSGFAYNSVAGNLVYGGLFVDTTESTVIASCMTGTAVQTLAGAIAFTTSESMHSISPSGSVNAGTSAYYVAAYGMIRG